MLYDLVVVSIKLIPVFLLFDLLGKVNVGEIKSNEDVNIYFLTKFITLSNGYYKLKKYTTNTYNFISDVLSPNIDYDDSEPENNIELIRLYVLKPNKIIQGLFTYYLEDDEDYEEEVEDEVEEDDEDYEEEVEDEVEEDYEEDVEEEDVEEEDVEEDVEEDDVEEEEYEDEFYISEDIISEPKILFAGGNYSEITDQDVVYVYDNPTKSYQEVSLDLIHKDNNKKTIVNLINAINSQMYNKSFFINVQLTLNDEIIDITSVSSYYYRTGNTLFGYKMLNYLTNFKYDISKDTEYSLMIMDSNVNMITINNKQTISLINDNNEINYKINNLN